MAAVVLNHVHAASAPAGATADSNGVQSNGAAPAPAKKPRKDKKSQPKPTIIELLARLHRSAFKELMTRRGLDTTKREVDLRFRNEIYWIMQRLMPQIVEEANKDNDCKTLKNKHLTRAVRRHWASQRKRLVPNPDYKAPAPKSAQGAAAAPKRRKVSKKNLAASAAIASAQAGAPVPAAVVPAASA